VYLWTLEVLPMVLYIYRTENRQINFQLEIKFKCVLFMGM